MELRIWWRFIDNLQPNNSNAKLSQCYGIFLTSLNLTCTKVKTYPNPVMTQYIRCHFRKPTTLQVRNRAEILASSPLTLEHKTVVYSPLPHKWSIIVCSERPSGKNRITQELVHQFASQINLLVLTWHKSLPEVICKHTLVCK